MNIIKTKENHISKKILKCLVCVTFVFVIAFDLVYGASDPTLVTKINSAFKKILTYLQKKSIFLQKTFQYSVVILYKLVSWREE